MSGPALRSWHQAKTPDAIRVGGRHFGSASPEPIDHATPETTANGGALDALIEAARVGDDRPAHAQLLTSLGAEHLRAGRFDWATEAFSEALEDWKAVSDADGQASAVCNVALAVARRGGWAAAQAQLEALAVPDARLGGVRDVNLGVLTMQGGDFAAALDCFDRAFAVGRELDDDPLKAAALNNAALAYALAGNVGEASPLLERAALLAQRIPDRIGNARAYNNIGVLNFQAGRLFEAIPYFEMALSLVEESGDRPAILEILNNNVLAFEQQYLEPATAFRTAFQAALDAGDRPHADRFVDAASMTMPTTRDGAGASELEPGQGEVLSRARALLWCALARC